MVVSVHYACDIEFNWASEVAGRKEDTRKEEKNIIIESRNGLPASSTNEKFQEF